MKKNLVTIMIIIVLISLCFSSVAECFMGFNGRGSAGRRNSVTHDVLFPGTDSEEEHDMCELFGFGLMFGAGIAFLAGWAGMLFAPPIAQGINAGAIGMGSASSNSSFTFGGSFSTITFGVGGF